jgi:uncharacterized cupredoxin-like copper-binding protein
MKPKNLFLGIALVIASFLFAACGGGNSSSGEFSVSVNDDFTFDPSVLRVSAGQEITITFTNEASVEHTFNILIAGGELDHLLGDASEGEADEHDDGDDHSEEELHEQVLLEMHEVKPGDSATKTFTAPSEPGDYIIFCSLPGHADAGMVGILTVEP